MKNLKKLILALAIAGTSISCNMKKGDKEDLETGYITPGRPPITNLLDTNYKIKMIYDDGGKSSENLKVESFLTPFGDAICFRNYTQDYSRIYEEKEKIPMHLRYTKLNSEWSEIYILHSKKVEISDINQTAYFVPQHGWEELKPYEKHREAQQLVEGSEKLLDWTLDKIPFSEDVLNIILKKAEKTKQKYYSELLEKTNKNYVIEKIPAHIPTKLFGHTETAREYSISFNLDNLNESSETYLVANIFLGDPSESSGNSFQNKRGELEGILIKFNLKPTESMKKDKPETKSDFELAEKNEGIEIDEENIKESSLEDYFLQGKELRNIETPEKIQEYSLHCGGGIIKNKKIITSKECNNIENNLDQIGVAKYFLILSNGKSKAVQMKILDFNSIKKREEFLKNADEIRFIKNDIVCLFEKLPMGDYVSLEENLASINLLFNYRDRTGMELFIGEDEEDNQRYKDWMERIYKKYNGLSF